MKSYKKVLCLTLAFAMAITMVAGCTPASNNPADPGVIASSSEPSSTDSSAESSENDDPAEEDAFSYSEGLDENGFFEDVTALDYIELFNYKALSIPSDVHQVAEADLQTEIDNLMASYASSEQIMDRAAVQGDTVNIDYVGSVDGVEFEGGSTFGEGTDVTIGVTSYIDDFLEQLIGHKPGETINVEVTFPDVYQEASLQGKDAVFVTTINYIVNQVNPELTDDFIKSNFFDSYGWDTVAAMKEQMTVELQKEAIRLYIGEYIVNDVNVRSVPDVITEYQEKAMLQYYRDGAEYYGVEFEEFLNGYAGVSNVEELLEDNRESNMQNAIYTLVAQAVAEDAKVSVTEEDMIDYFTDYSQYVEQYGLPYLKQVVLFQKVIDSIIENAVLE